MSFKKGLEMSVSPESYFSHDREVGKLLSSSVPALSETEGGAQVAWVASAPSWLWVLYCMVTCRLLGAFLSCLLVAWKTVFDLMLTS